MKATINSQQYSTMKTLFLLILLTQNGAGDINAAFVNTTTREQCQQKALAVAGIFSSAGIPILERRCIQSGLRFTPFEHQAGSRVPRHFYLLEFKPQGVEIQPMADWRGCMQGQRVRRKEGGRAYCASSTQQPRRGASALPAGVQRPGDG